MDVCTAYVMQGGDNRMCYQIPERAPRTYAEIVLLRAVHGGEAYVTKVKKTGEIETSSMQEKLRLKAIYGAKADEIYPGINPNLPTDCSGDNYLLHEPADPAPPIARRGNKGKADTAFAG